MNGESATEISDIFFRFPIDSNRKTCYYVITTEKPVKHERRTTTMKNIEIPICKEQRFFEGLIKELVKVLADFEMSDIIAVFEFAQTIVREKNK